MFRDVPEPLGSLLTLRAAVLGVQPPTHLLRSEQTAALRICACAICLIVQETSRQLGQYGCVKSHADQDVFRAGLIAAIERIHPRMVLSYGPHPDRIFGGLEAMTEFVFYEDWTSRMRRHHG